ncbi:MAG: energy transducer TonB [Croceibacterium sp.]
MASLANLSREERIGLGIAALAHGALVAALMWQVGKPPERTPAPERIEVSLADDVSLTSTAPDPSPASQAAIAPSLVPEPSAPEPIPTVAVEPDIRPAVPAIRQPATKPSPAPRATANATAKPSAKPAPAPSKTAGGSRLGTDFLAGVGGSERSIAKGTPAATFGPAEQASLSQAINRQLKPHWSAPQGVDAELLVTVLSWELNPDGTLKGAPQLVSQSGITDSNRPQAKLHAERAIRAVQLAAPFDLPDAFYDKWKRVRTWRFDRKL